MKQYFVPDFKLLWSGWTAYRTCFDATLTESIPNLPEDSIHWWGPKTSFFSSRLGKNSYTVVGSINADPENPDAQLKHASWDDKASVQDFRDLYAVSIMRPCEESEADDILQDWNPVVKALAEAAPSIRLYPNLSCATTLDSWIFGDRVVLIGDAAHAHGGAHATGGSLSIDDAYALFLALTTVFPATATKKPSSKQISKALKLYERTRKPHAERLLKLVHSNNAVRLAKLRSGVVETDEELRARAAKGSNTTWLHEHDVVKTFQDTLRLNATSEISDLKTERPRL